jgi:hypothetical protein
MLSFDIINNLTGDVYITIHSNDNNFNYWKLKKLFQRYIITYKIYVILNQDKYIYTNLVDFTNKYNNTSIVITNLSIVFLNYQMLNMIQFRKELQLGHFNKLRTNSELCSCKLFMFFAFKHNINTLKHISNDLKNDKEFILSIIKEDCNTYLYILDTPLAKDKDIMFSAVKQKNVLKYVVDIIKNNKELYLDNNFCRKLFLTAVKHDGMSLEHVFVMYKDDKQIVESAIKQNQYALSFASKNLRNDKNIVISAVYKHGYTLEFASNALRNDKEVVLLAVKQNRNAFQFASDTLKLDKDIINAKLSKFEKEILVINNNNKYYEQKITYYKQKICDLLLFIISYFLLYCFLINIEKKMK